MQPPTRPCLLFVDDEPRLLNAMRAVFKSGYDVTIATNGFDALALLHKQHYDVIITDQRMPGMTGIEFLRRARKIAPNSVRVVLSGYADADAVTAAINEVEVHRFLKKPWDNATLRRIVAEAVGIARASREDDEDAPTQIMEDEAPRAALKETLVVVDPDQSLHAEVQAEFGGRYEVAHCTSLVDCLAMLERKDCAVLVCALDVERERDRVFLMQLKQDYPKLMVITLCNSGDPPRLIELINGARIFRFMRRPGSFQLLARYLYSAFEQARRHKRRAPAEEDIQ